MIGYVMPEGRGTGDRLLFDLAAALHAEGLRLAGAVQTNVERADGTPCDMDLHVLTGGAVVPISQRLGPGARGCRLDPDGLERAVGLALAALERPVDLVIVNKFGKQEATGHGFRTVFGAALESGRPVITAISPAMRDAFLDFAGDLVEPVAPHPEALAAWARAAVAGRKPA